MDSQAGNTSGGSKRILGWTFAGVLGLFVAIAMGEIAHTSSGLFALLVFGVLGAVPAGFLISSIRRRSAGGILGAIALGLIVYLAFVVYLAAGVAGMD